MNSLDIHNSGRLNNATLLHTVSGIPNTPVVYVRLWSETAVDTDSYWVFDYTYNSDLDSDGISDVIDPDPAIANPMQRFAGPDYALTILGSGRIASLESASLFNATFDGMSGEMSEITTIVYAHLKDKFDFVIVASNQEAVPSGTYSGIFYPTRNDVQGIGKGLFDSTALYGSSGRLQGAIHLTSTDGLVGGPGLHEIAHNWANSMSSVPSTVSGHWGYSNIGGQLGGWLPGSLESLGEGQYCAKNPRTGVYARFGSFANGGNCLPYSPFELYTMGLLSAGDVGHDIKIANDFTWVVSSEGRFSASSITTRTMADVVTIDGVRVPDHLTSQKHFRILYLVLTPNPLSTGEWAAFDEDVHSFSLDADNGVSLYNFWEATGGRATVGMDGLLQSIRGGPSAPIRGVSSGPGVQTEVTVMGQNESGYVLFYSTDLKEWIGLPVVAGPGSELGLTHNSNGERTLFFRVEEDP